MAVENEVLDLFSNESFEDIFSTMSIPDIMRTDIYVFEGQIMIEVELPGYSNQDISAELKDGMLTIMASKVHRLEKISEKRRYIKRERHIDGCKRSYFIGSDISEDNVKAAFKHGVLKVMVDVPDYGIEERLLGIEKLR